MNRLIRRADMFLYPVPNNQHGTLVCVPQYAWKKDIVKLPMGAVVECWHAGLLSDLVSLCSNFVTCDVEGINEILLSENGPFGVILRYDESVFAACDRIQSFPVHLEYQDGRVGAVSADGRLFQVPEYGSQFSEELSDIFLATGYCLGSRTLLSNVVRLLPGELLFQSSDTSVRSRYYTYKPDFSEVTREGRSFQAELGDVLDDVIQNVLEIADGRQVVLSLSAGFDSRLLLGKLVEHGCKNLSTFSYGSIDNMEAKEAQRFASLLGIPWEFIEADPEDIKDYHLGECRQYLRFAAGVHTTPVMTEYFALKQLAKRGFSRENSIFINGQTGDFLTGGHLVDVGSFAELAAYLNQKHFSLGYKSGDFPDDLMHKKDALIGWGRSQGLCEDDLSVNDIHAFNLFFEWQERQANYVVNQQRAYDWFNLDWVLPFWHPRLMEFYATVPVELQINQVLYTDYLKSWNFGGLFEEMRAPYNPWSKRRRVIQTLGRVVGVVFGAEVKKRFYQRLHYFSDQNYMYRLFSSLYYMKYYSNIRTPATLFTIDVLNMLREDFGVEISRSIDRDFSKHHK